MAVDNYLSLSVSLGINLLYRDSNICLDNEGKAYTPSYLLRDFKKHQKNYGATRVIYSPHLFLTLEPTHVDKTDSDIMTIITSMTKEEIREDSTLLKLVQHSSNLYSTVDLLHEESRGLESMINLMTGLKLLVFYCLEKLDLVFLAIAAGTPFIIVSKHNTNITMYRLTEWTVPCQLDKILEALEESRTKRARKIEKLTHIRNKGRVIIKWCTSSFNVVLSDMYIYKRYLPFSSRCPIIGPLGTPDGIYLETRPDQVFLELNKVMFFPWIGLMFGLSNETLQLIFQSKRFKISLSFCMTIIVCNQDMLLTVHALNIAADLNLNIVYYPHAYPPVTQEQRQQFLDYMAELPIMKRWSSA